MALTIGTNLSSLRAQRRLGDVSSALSKVQERLATGQRINKASDDPAGLAVADDLRSTAVIYARAAKNGNDGISMLSIADGAVNELSSITTRLAELAESASNGAYKNTQRVALDREARELVKEYNRIVATTSFNGQTLLQPNQQASLMLGATSDAAVTVSTSAGLTRALGTDSWGTETSVAGDSSHLTLAADFNNDGIADLAVADTGRVMLGNGDGTFRYGPAVITASNGIRTGDMNGDGKLDLVGLSNNSVQIVLGNGDGTFRASRSFVDSAAPKYFGETGDLNNDGKTDVITLNGNAGGSSLAVFLGNGDGTLQAAITLPFPVSSGTVNGLAIMDVNEDGVNDILHSDASGYVYLATGNGNGTLTAPQLVVRLTGAQKISRGDINNDGHIDIGVGGAVALSNGDGTFKAPFTLAASGPWNADDVFADVNGDGLLDQVIGLNTWSQAFYGNGDGTFSAGISRAAQGRPSALVDINGDGVCDIVGSGVATGTYLAVQSTTQTSTMQYLGLTTAASARASLEVAKTALSRTGMAKAYIGAYQSRVESATNYLNTAVVAANEAESRIRDADVATEAAEMVRLQILRQSAAAVLGQANQEPRIVLSLLGK